MSLIEEHEHSIINALREAAYSFKKSECEENHIKRNDIILNMIRYRKLLYSNKEDEKSTLRDVKAIIQKNLNEEVERRGNSFV